MRLIEVLHSSLYKQRIFQRRSIRLVDGDLQHPLLRGDVAVGIAVQKDHNGRASVCLRSLSPHREIHRGRLTDHKKVGKGMAPIRSDRAEESDVRRVAQRDARNVCNAVNLGLKHDRVGRWPLCL